MRCVGGVRETPGEEVKVAVTLLKIAHNAMY